MLTGISGSKTVESASMIRGVRAAAREASAVMPPVCIALEAEAGGAADGFWMTGKGFMRVRLLRGYDLVASFGGGTERVPRQRRAFDANRELADACQHGELAEILDRRIGTRR